jgi:hypothetical protein
MQREFRDASRLLRDLPSQHSGFSKEQEKAVRDIQQAVDSLGDQLARQAGIDTATLTTQQRQVLYEVAAEQLGHERAAGTAAFLVRPGSRGDTVLRNPEYEDFLIDNEELLRRFYPRMYSRETLREAYEVAR